VKKKVLNLGGAYSQIPMIQYAAKLGYEIITLDYLPDNPGHKYSHSYINCSTTDMDQVLANVQNANISAVLAYASDPSALTAAYVAQKLFLKGPSFSAVKILSEKDAFRSFQMSQGFSHPKFVSSNNLEALKKQILLNLTLPYYLKPVDAAGSRGVHKITHIHQLDEAFFDALSHSRVKRVIVEEEVKSNYAQIHGDGFMFNDQLIFLGLCDQYFKSNAPIGSVYPSKLPNDLQRRIALAVEDTLRCVGFNDGAVNVEVRINDADEIMVLEIGPRSGGNYIPQLMQQATGFNEMEAILNAALGELVNTKASTSRFCFQYIINAQENGKFNDIYISDELKKHVKHLYVHKKKGDSVLAYNNSSKVVGVLIAEFQEPQTMESIFNNIQRHVHVELMNTF
jgi:biotin carboxylase